MLSLRYDVSNWHHTRVCKTVMIRDSFLDIGENKVCGTLQLIIKS